MAGRVVINIVLYDKVVDTHIVQLAIIDDVDSRDQVDAPVASLHPLSFWGLFYGTLFFGGSIVIAPLLRTLPDHLQLIFLKLLMIIINLINFE